MVYQDNTHGKENGRDKDRPDFGRRKRNLEWRDTWFHLTRTRNQEALGEQLLNALHVKHRLIKLGAEIGDHMAGYGPPAPASAGTPWFNIGPRNINGRIKALTVHPTNANIVYAGAAGGGVWRSLDGCQSWYPLWDQQESLAVSAIAIARSDPNVVYAGTGEWTPGWGFYYPGTGVYVSTDGGITWTRRAGVNTPLISQILVSHTNPQTVYVACNNGFRFSSDGGVTWSTSHAGEISDAVMSPTDANTIYIAVRSDAIYKTTDGGTTWTQLTAGPMGADAGWLRLTIGHTGAHGTNFIASKQDGTIRISIDGGTTWTALAGSHGGVSYHQWTNLFAVAPNNENILLAGAVGVERTADGGTTWSWIDTSVWDHHRAVFAPSDNNIVYLCADSGVSRSTNQGATWRKTSDGLIVTQFYDLGSWETLSNVAGGGTQDTGTVMTTGGLTWRSIYGWDGGYFVINPNNPREIYAEHQNMDLAKSIDGGNTWVGVRGGLTGSTPWVGVITMDLTTPSRLFCGSNSVFRTLDGCATNWVQVSQLLSGDVSSLAIAPSNTNRVYASTGSGSIYRTDDGGATNPWADKTAAPLPTFRPITDMAVFRTDANHVAVLFGSINFGGSAANHVFLSTDAGDSWTDISGNLPNINMNAIVFHPANSATLYVGTDVGVFRTIDGGVTWTAFDNGIPNVIITDLHIDNEDATLYASTMGRGMYKVSITGAMEPVVDLYLRDSLLDTGERFSTPSNFPDPNDTTNQVFWWTSPDIKVEVQPFYTPDPVFDGVEFDTDVIHDDPQRNRTNRFYLQVHNRGWQNATNVRIRAFFTDASAGLPNLPADFWTAFPTSDPAPNAWLSVGAMQSISTLEPNRPVILSWDWLIPTTAATHSCLLAIITCNEEPLTTTELNIATLITSTKQMCLKNLHVINGSGPAPSMVTLGFHNALPDDDLIDIVFQPSNFVGGSYGLLLPPVEFADEREALEGVTVYGLREGEFIGQWYDPSGELEPELKALYASLDLTRVFEFDPTKVSELRGIRLPPGESLHGVVTLLGRRIETGKSQQFTVMQRQKGHIVGGSTYELRPKRVAQPLSISRIRVILEKVQILNDHDPWIKGAGDFTFVTAITFNNDPDRRQYCRVPQRGNIHISDFPLQNTATLDVCVFDGLVMESDSIQLSILPVEEDWLDPDDEMGRYSRSFASPPESWVGRYSPDDESEADPESLKEWRVWYRIESVRI